MELDGNILTVEDKKADVKEYSSDESFSGKIYRITYDISSKKELKRELINTISKGMYGLYENSDGTFCFNIALPKAAYYSGCHVIFNGTPMRSYNLEWSLPNAQTNYWIRVEDLEHYGYDMVTDFEGRATYFTQNPKKEWTPLGFDGTDERLPVYESDWKIYIDGKQPRLAFNIGGSTLVYCGELGSLKAGTIWENYDVMNVTSAKAEI